MLFYTVSFTLWSSLPFLYQRKIRTHDLKNISLSTVDVKSKSMISEHMCCRFLTWLCGSQPGLVVNGLHFLGLPVVQRLAKWLSPLRVLDQDSIEVIHLLAHRWWPRNMLSFFTLWMKIWWVSQIFVGVEPSRTFSSGQTFPRAACYVWCLKT